MPEQLTRNTHWNLTVHAITTLGSQRAGSCISRKITSLTTTTGHYLYALLYGGALQ